MPVSHPFSPLALAFLPDSDPLVSQDLGFPAVLDLGFPAVLDLDLSLSV